MTPEGCVWDQPDYAIVGAGASGSMVAWRLAKARPEACILVLEAGGPYRGRRPAFDDAWALGGLDPGKTPAPWSPPDVPRLWSDMARVPQLLWPIQSAVVSRLAGGSGAANAMIYVRALASDVRRWNASRWTWPGVARRYARLERRLDAGGAWRGGPLPTRRAPRYEDDALAQAWLEGCERYGLRVVDDFNAPNLTRAGVAGPYHFTIDQRGRRASAYATLLEPLLGNSRVKLETRATAERLAVSGGRAKAVVVRPKSGIALCAGALNTPRLLLASGLGGPRAGKNLRDHPVLPLRLELSTDAFHRDPGPFSDWVAAAGADTLWASPGTSVGAFVRSSACGPGEPADLQLTLFAPGQAEPHVDEVLDEEAGRTFFASREALVTIALLRPDAVHSVELNASDAAAPPVLKRGPRNSSWYQRPRCPGCRSDTAWVTNADAARLLDGVAVVQQLVATRPLDGAVAFVDAPPPGDRLDEGRLAWVRARALTNSHWVGTAAMGDAPDAAVDGDLRLRGAANVVVADASAIPYPPNGNVHSTVLVFADHAADTLLED